LSFLWVVFLVTGFKLNILQGNMPLLLSTSLGNGVEGKVNIMKLKEKK
jgi:hypothetical protein